MSKSCKIKYWTYWQNELQCLQCQYCRLGIFCQIKCQNSKSWKSRLQNVSKETKLKRFQRNVELTDNVNFSAYSVNFVALASHALVESSIFLGDTFKFKSESLSWNLKWGKSSRKTIKNSKINVSKNQIMSKIKDYWTYLAVATPSDFSASSLEIAEISLDSWPG